VNTSAPFLLVRARLRPSKLAEFEQWHRTVHVPHVPAVPGITAYRRVRLPAAAEANGPNHMAIFLFRDEESIQPALGSSESDKARRDWEHWAAEVRELSIQIYAPLDSRALLRHLN
jgi:uncharacterized protein (TIGR02118 family)